MCRGILPGYEIRFNKTPGPRRGTGYANIVPAAEKWVEGVLYLLTELDLEQLDTYEGAPTDYRRYLVNVWNVDHKRWVKAVTYVAVRTDDTLKPPKDYLSEILNSAKVVGLSIEWINMLEKLLEKAL